MAENKYYGIYQGVVTNIKDPEKRGRIKIKCPDVLGGSTESAWCDPVVPVAYDNGGDFCIPTKDETVWVQFIAGDANRPVYLGGWWQKNMTPLGNTYTDLDKVRIISYGDCTITLKDGRIDINVGAGSCDLRIEDNEITIRGNLTVTGSVTAGDIIATASDDSEGTIKAEGTISTDSTIMADGSITSSKQVKGSTVVAGNVSLTTHTHSGVTAGGANTGQPVK